MLIILLIAAVFCLVLTLTAGASELDPPERNGCGVRDPVSIGRYRGGRRASTGVG
jgi:hypothetical protein